MTVYIPEVFQDDESEILKRYFTNLDLPVFALVNLPEVVKGALFARYSRSPKSLRRLFLDEFVNDLDLTGDIGVDATIGIDKAEALYEKVFVEYGDDSVAQLGGGHRPAGGFQRLAYGVEGADLSVEAGSDGTPVLMKPVDVMAALAMMIGMVPMALGLGEGGEQNAPLGRAVIGGLIFATIATLIFVPVVFALAHEKDHLNLGKQHV